MNKDINNLQKLYESQEKSITVTNWEEKPEDYTGHVKHIDGTQCWYEHGKYHREDGPAIILSNGTQYWYKNGQWHREGGPAVIWPNGDQYWYQNGKFHREDGPAVIRPNVEQRYYLNDELFTKENFYRELYKLGKITQEELFVELL